nr:chemosensory protein 14 [Pachyrhinus yasumatsui]
MQNLAIFVFFALSTVAYCIPGIQYTTKYDSIDLDAIIKNERLLRSYIDCMLEKKKCNKDGAELKRHIPEALENDCLKCSEVQRNGSRKILKHLVNNKREWFIELEAKYDSAHNYRERYDAEFKKAGVIW